MQRDLGRRYGDVVSALRDVGDEVAVDHLAAQAEVSHGWAGEHNALVIRDRAIK